MQIGSFPTPSLARTGAGPSSARNEAQAGGQADVPTAGQQALDAMSAAAKASDSDAKARAKQRLEDAKQQLAFLRRWGFDPRVIARQGGELARQVAAAARDFTGAMPEGPAAAPQAGTADQAATAMQPADAQGDGAGGGDGDGDEGSFAQKAYREAMSDGAATPALSDDDSRTLDDFKTVARQIRSLIEEALRRLRAQKAEGSAAAAQQASASLDQAVAALDTVMQSVSTATATATGSASVSLVL